MRLLAALRILVFGSLCLCSAIAYSQTEDWLPELVDDAYSGYREANDSFTIKLPELSDDVLGQLRLELDAIDVTSQVLAAEDGRSATFTPPAPLDPGVHELRLVQVIAKGEILERGVWRFEVRESREIREGVFNYAVSTQGTARVAQSDELDGQIVNGEPSSYQYGGSTRFDAYVDSGVFETTGHADLLADGNYRVTGVERPFELGNYLVQMESQNWHGSLGHHLPSATGESMQSNLILDGYPRRGVSMGLRTDNRRAAFSNYFVRTEQITGFNDGFGVGHSDHRLHGINTRFVPIVTPNTELVIGTAYLRGKGEEAGVGFGGATELQSGESGNVVIDGYFWKKQVNVRGEYAKARFQAGRNLDTDSDDAYTVYAGFQPDQAPMVFSEPLYYSFGMDHARFGSFYRSIGNLQTLRDVEETRAEWSGQYRNFILQINGGRATDNVDDDPAYPTTRLRSFSTDFGWTPQSDFWPSWAATPSFGISGFREDRDTIKRARSTNSLRFPSDDIDTQTHGGSVWAQFAHPFGYWGISYSPAESIDGNGPEFWQETTSLQSGFTFFDRLSINPALSYDKSRDRDAGIDFRTTSVVLDTQLAIVRDWWDISFSASQQQTRSSDDQTDTETKVYYLRSSWYLSAVQLWLEANRNEFVSGGASLDRNFPVVPVEDSSYQIFTGISFSLPLQRGDVLP